MNEIAPLRVRGAPRTFATSVRLRDVLAVHVGPQRARSIVEHLTAIELLPAGSRRFSVPVSPCNSAFALVTAASDAGNASDAACRALHILAYRRHSPGEPPGLTVLETLTGEIEDGGASEWHLGLACAKRLDDHGEFELYLPQPVADPTAIVRRFPFERIDTLPAAAIADVAAMLRMAD
jgi:hypothetical protein